MLLDEMFVRRVVNTVALPLYQIRINSYTITLLPFQDGTLRAQCCCYQNIDYPSLIRCLLI